MYVAHKTPGAITALLDFPAVRIENAIAKIGRSLRFLNQQNLITSDAEMPIGQKTDLLLIQIEGLMYSVQNHKIIAQSVHFGEFQLQRSTVPALPVSQGHQIIIHHEPASNIDHAIRYNFESVMPVGRNSRMIVFVDGQNQCL